MDVNTSTMSTSTRFALASSAINVIILVALALGVMPPLRRSAVQAELAGKDIQIVIDRLGKVDGRIQHLDELIQKLAKYESVAERMVKLLDAYDLKVKKK